jgi:hypothetical protein
MVVSETVKIGQKGSGPLLTGGWRNRETSRAMAALYLYIPEGPVSEIRGHDCATIFRPSTFISGAKLRRSLVVCR